MTDSTTATASAAVSLNQLPETLNQLAHQTVEVAKDTTNQAKEFVGHSARFMGNVASDVKNRDLPIPPQDAEVLSQRWRELQDRFYSSLEIQKTVKNLFHIVDCLKMMIGTVATGIQGVEEEFRRYYF